MTTTSMALENALYCLQAAEDAARFFHRDPQLLSKIQLLKRATAKVLREVRGEVQAGLRTGEDAISPDSSERKAV